MRVSIVDKEWAQIPKGFELDSRCQYEDPVGKRSCKSPINAL